MSVTNAQIVAATRAAHAAIKALDKEALAALAKVYRDAFAQISMAIISAAAGGDQIGLDRLQPLKRQVEEILTNLERLRNAQLNSAIQRAATLGATPFDALAPAIDVAGSVAAQRVAQDAVKFVTSFIGNDGLQLSDRLWRMDTAARNNITNTITRAIVSGQGAAEAARELLSRGAPVSADIASKMKEASAVRLSNQIKSMLNGDGNPMANALRVMRTEINRAHGEAWIASFIDHPDFGGLKFELSPAHPAPDICDLLSTQNLYGLGPGVYPSRDKCPWPAHPNTLSFIQPVFVDEVTAADKAGKQTQAEALAKLSAEQRRGVLGAEKATLFSQGKFRRDMLPAPFRV